jgi:hypothetical protein
VILARQGNYAAAEPPLRQAVDVLKETKQDKGAWMSQTLRALETVCRATGRTREADDLEAMNREIVDAAPASPSTAPTDED